MRREKLKLSLVYALVVVTTLICLWLTLWLQVFDNKPSQFVFLGGIMVCSAVGGLMPGLVSLFLSAVCSAYFVFSPVHSFELTDYASLARWVLFQLVGLLIVSMNASRRAAAQRLSESENRLYLALDAGRIGVLDYDLDTQALYLSDGMAALFGQKRRQFANDLDQLTTFIHADDREFFRRSLARTAADRVDYEVDFRVVRSDGSLRWLVTRGRGYVAKGTGARRVVGVVSESSSDAIAAFERVMEAPAADITEKV